ncbi:MAG: cell division protein SepF [Thermoplasmatales archaeon]|nr:cell division protein SepF [Thermoplasmatales archaeon]
MGFFDKILGQKKPVGEPDKFIDLTEWVEPGMEKSDESVKMTVKVAEIYRYEDLGNLTAPVYNGNMLLLDFSPIAGDDFMLRRITTELKQMTSDIGGDIAGVGRNMFIVTPSGVRIDREKIRGTY